MSAWRREVLDIVVSEHILRELERTLRKPYFAARLEDRDREEFLGLLRRFGSVVEIVGPIPTVCSTTADNLVLAMAMTAQTPYLVSGDRELLELGEFQDLRIISARQMLDILLAANADREWRLGALWLLWTDPMLDNDELKIGLISAVVVHRDRRLVLASTDSPHPPHPGPQPSPAAAACIPGPRRARRR